MPPTALTDRVPAPLHRPRAVGQNLNDLAILLAKLLLEEPPPEDLPPEDLPPEDLPPEDLPDR